jgi:hypothetical protein
VEGLCRRRLHQQFFASRAMSSNLQYHAKPAVISPPFGARAAGTLPQACRHMRRWRVWRDQTPRRDSQDPTQAMMRNMLSVAFPCCLSA